MEYALLLETLISLTASMWNGRSVDVNQIAGRYIHASGRIQTLLEQQVPCRQVSVRRVTLESHDTERVDLSVRCTTTEDCPTRHTGES
jgi:hypothetical protein